MVRRRRRSSAAKFPPCPSDLFFTPIFRDDGDKYKRFLDYLTTLSEEDFQNVITTVLAALAGECTEFTEELSSKLEVELLVSLFKKALRTEKKVLKTDLSKLQIEEDKIKFMYDSLAQNGNKIIQHEQTEQDLSSFPSFKDLHWRIDVTLTSSKVKTVRKPSVLLGFTLSDDSVHTMQCSVEQFHQMRYDVAKLLRQMIYNQGEN